MSALKIKPWRKNLYENEGYPDNYTDSSFLQELRKNIHKEDVTFSDAVLASGKITEKLCIVTIFSVIFFYLFNELIQPETVFITSSILVCLFYIYYIQALSLPNPVIGRDMKTVIIFLVFGYILCPVLKTLTETISTDTIYATVAVMLLIHLMFFDYTHPAAIVPSSLSLNAAIFSSVCLASRLSTSFHAFVLLTISAELFALYPYFSHFTLKITIPFISFMIFFTLIFLTTTSVLMSFLFVMVSIFINLLCPYLFVHWQKYKDNIYGPWDEAVIKENDNKSTF